MIRATRTFAAVTMAAALVLTGCGGSDDDAKDTGSKSLEKVVYLTSFGNFGRDAFVWVAKEKGYFKEAGFDVEIRPGQGTNGVQIVAAGEAQFAAGDFAGAMLQITKNNLDVKAVALIQQRSLSAIMALQESKITSPKDLEGKTIADLPTSVNRLLFPAYAKLAGIDASKVRFVDSQPDQLIGLLGSGKVDAIGQFVVGRQTVETVTGKPAVVFPFSDLMVDLPGNALWVSGKFLRDKPDAVQRFRDALLRGLEDALANPEEAGKILADNVPTANAQAAAVELQLMQPYAGNAPYGTIDPARIARAIALLQSMGAIPAGFTPERVVAVELSQ